MIVRPINFRKSGFTMLEVVIALGLMAILIGMIFSTARSSLLLGNRIVETQNEEMLNQAFFELLHQRFSSLPGNTRLQLKADDAGSHYLSDLTLQNVPLSFTWGGQARTAKAVQISTVKKRSNNVDIVLRYYENEILEDSASTAKKSAGENKPFAEIVLLSEVTRFEWRVLDERSMEWDYDWDFQGRLPLQLELTMVKNAKDEEIREIFWIPAKVNPQTRINQTMQNQNSNPNPNRDNGSGGDIKVPAIDLPKP